MIHKIGDAFSLIRNGANIKQGMDDTGYPITRIETISNRVVDRNKMGYAGIHDLTRYADYVLQDGDILMSHINSESHLGKTALYEKRQEEIIIHGMNLLCLRPKPELINSHYAYCFLSSDRFLHQIPKIAKKSVNQASFTVAALKELDIIIVPMERQLVIVRVLDKINEIITLQEKQLAKLDELVKSRFIEMFGDPVVNPYGYDVCTLQEMIENNIILYHLDGNHGGDYPRSEEFVESGIPYIGANCVSEGAIDFSHAKYLQPERAAKLHKGIAVDGDVLFAHNATVGPVAVLHTTEEKVVLSTSLTAYRCNQSMILPDYLKTYMQSDGFVRQYSSDMKQTTRNQVPITAQKKYLFIVPPIELQNQFADFVQATDKSKLEIRASLDKLEMLKKSLMQQYFG